MAICSKLTDYKRQYSILNGVIKCNKCGLLIDTEKYSYVKNTKKEEYYHAKCFKQIKENLL